MADEADFEDTLVAAQQTVWSAENQRHPDAAYVFYNDMSDDEDEDESGSDLEKADENVRKVELDITMSA
ncbi:Hypothetical predicted protein [Lecanosticta acicola]|uniref:Uncharacterized protein n=1 Tax=Lecanosticta acicola TaxID=111012 RepID=A0AAI8Z485_9PEZI|nr:Hypothetical predicted protein [Lecanosticta acicola]